MSGVLAGAISMLGLIVAVYRSLKAFRHPEGGDGERWLQFWVLVAAADFLGTAVWAHFFELRSALILCLLLPGKGGVATRAVFNGAAVPVLARCEDAADRYTARYRMAGRSWTLALLQRLQDGVLRYCLPHVSAAELTALEGDLQARLETVRREARAQRVRRLAASRSSASTGVAPPDAPPPDTPPVRRRTSARRAAAAAASAKRSSPSPSAPGRKSKLAPTRSARW